MSESDRAPEAAVGLIRPITDFYARVLGSPRLAHYFDGTAMEVLVAKQTAFISAALTGDTRYKREELRRAHVRFAIRDNEFDELIAILTSSLDDHGISTDKRRLIVATFENFRDVIVRRSPVVS